MKVGIIDAGLLPEVGEGIDGSPVVAPLDCPEGGEGMKVAVTPDAGPGYVLNANGSSCYGSTAGSYNTLETDIGGERREDRYARLPGGRGARLRDARRDHHERCSTPTPA